MTLHVTNRRVIVTGDVNLDIQMFYVAKVNIVKTIQCLENINSLHMKYHLLLNTYPIKAFLDIEKQDADLDTMEMGAGTFATDIV